MQRFNLQAEHLNRRIVAALLRAVKIDAEGPFKDLVSLAEDASPNPQRWWAWWHDYNEQYTSGEKPYYGYDYDWSTTTAHDRGYNTGTNTTDDPRLVCACMHVLLRQRHAGLDALRPEADRTD